MSEKRGRVFVGTDSAVSISPDDGVEGHGDDAFPVCLITVSLEEIRC
jgi:hypothetical protein